MRSAGSCAAWSATDVTAVLPEPVHRPRWWAPRLARALGGVGA